MANQNNAPAKSSALFLLALSVEVVIAICIGPVLSGLPLKSNASTLPPLTRLDSASKLRSPGSAHTRYRGNLVAFTSTTAANGGGDQQPAPIGPQVSRLDSTHLRANQKNRRMTAVKKHFSHRDHRDHRENKNPNEILLSGSAGGLAATSRANKGSSTPLLFSTAGDREKLLDAIAVVESNNDPNAIGDGGKAVGAYQLHEIFVRDVNRIVGQECYALTDRLDAAKCREMIKIYWNHYGKGKGLMALARLFNGGPDGDREDATLGYAEKIKRVLDRMDRIGRDRQDLN